MIALEGEESNDFEASDKKLILGEIKTIIIVWCCDSSISTLIRVIQRRMKKKRRRNILLFLDNRLE